MVSLPTAAKIKRAFLSAKPLKTLEIHKNFKMLAGIGVGGSGFPLGHKPLAAEPLRVRGH